MLAFPQLSTGAMAQTPASRQTRYRNRRSLQEDGSVVELGDPDFEEREWNLVLRDLTDVELQGLEDLFAASRGKAGTFTFIDPSANMLPWSESLSVAPWAVAGTLLENQPDPTGGNAASHILAGGSVSQTLSAPSSYNYVATAWLRCAAAGASLQLSDGAATQLRVDLTPAAAWRRHALRYEATSSTDQIVFQIVNGSSSPLEVYGPQLEAQTAASAYKKSSGRGGLFPGARFDQDTLTDTAVGPGRHDTRVRIVWTPSQS